MSHSGRQRDLPQVLQQAQPAAAPVRPAFQPEQAANDQAVPAAAAPVPATAWFSKRKVVGSAIGLLVLLGLFYPVENVVVASGQVIPSDRVQTVQHLEGGIVTAVHVKEGQVVRLNQPLLDIDLGGSSLNLEQLTARKATAQAVKTRLSAESQGRTLKAGDFPAGLESRIVQAELGASLPARSNTKVPPPPRKRCWARHRAMWPKSRRASPACKPIWRCTSKRPPSPTNWRLSS